MQFSLSISLSVLLAAILGGAPASAWAQTPSPADVSTGDSPALYKDAGRSAEARVEDLLGRMTLDEKLRMLGGINKMNTQAVERLGIPNFIMTDGPVGAHTGRTTAYTAGIALAAAWDADLATRVGAALGRDCRARGVHILLGPGVNLYRAPMCGRNFEYFGEDPLLSGQTAAAYIRGLQAQGVAATLKHYAVNNEELDRHNLSSDLDEQTLRELYLRNFHIAVRDGQPDFVMTSYNPINGVHASQNRHLITDILKNEFGFRGAVMSDWHSTYDVLDMALAGLDLEMPEPLRYKPEKLHALLDEGRISPELIDDKVRRQLRVAFQMGWFDHPQLDPTIPKDDPSSDRVALDEAREGIVLLKNQGNLLPLQRDKVRRIALLGPNSDHAVTGGGGSSYTTPFHSVGILDGLKKLAADPAVVVPVAWKIGDVPTEDALRTVREADAVVICVGFDYPGIRNAGPDSSKKLASEFPPQAEGEAGDRAYTLPPGSSEMIRVAAQTNPRTVVVLNSGGSVATADWIDAPAALLHAFYPGQEGGQALAEILFGETNPSAKLPFSWEKRWEDSAAYGHYPLRDGPRVNDYHEGLLLGYRWFDAQKIEPLFPFGYGLSYTQFELSDFSCARDGAAAVVFTADARNTGSRAGAEVVQVYAAAPGGMASATSLPRPMRELKAFGQVLLQPGEKKTVTMRLNVADLAAWDPGANRWIDAHGQYLFQAGDCSRNLPLHAILNF